MKSRIVLLFSVFILGACAIDSPSTLEHGGTIGDGSDPTPTSAASGAGSDSNWSITVSWQNVTNVFQGDWADFTWQGTFQVDQNGLVQGSGDGTEIGECTPLPDDEYLPGSFGGTWDVSISGELKDGNFLLWLEPSNLNLEGVECYNFPENSEGLIRGFHLYLGEFQKEVPLVIPAKPGRHQGPAPAAQEPIEILLEAPGEG